MNGFKKIIAAMATMAVLAVTSAPAGAASSWSHIYEGFQGTTGEPVSLGNTLCYSATTGKYYKADADASTLRPIVGLAQSTITTNSRRVGVVTRGILAGQTGLTVGGAAYPSATAGAITQTAVAAYPQVIGNAQSTTEYKINVVPYSTAVPPVTGTTATFSGAVSLGDTTIGTAAVTNTMAVTGDISAAGGFKGIITLAQDNIVSSQAAVAMTLPGVTAVGVPMPSAGSILGISALSNSAITSGYVTFDVTINGSVTGIQAILNVTDTLKNSTTINKDVQTFSADDVIGVKITTPAYLAPTTADFSAGVSLEY